MKLRNKKTGAIAESYLIIDEPGIRRYAESIKDLCDHYEDYTPAEPLIKDEKIRKAVRAWAEALDLRWFRRCSPLNAYTSRLTGHNAEGVCYTMELAPKDLYGDKITKDSYTLAELCGEEEG